MKKKFAILVSLLIISGSLLAQFNCGDTLVDARDGKKYPTVQIGSQCWMQKNLNVGTMTPLATISSNNAVIEKYCYNGLTSNCDSTGGLYRWDEMMDYTTGPGGQGICPSGWFLPANADWDELKNNVGPPADLQVGGWTGFEGINARYIEDNNTYMGNPGIVYLWEATEAGANTGYYRIITTTSTTLYRENTGKIAGMSVRCLRPAGENGINDNKDDLLPINVFPNPSDGMVYFDHPYEVNAEVKDETGRTIFEGRVKNYVDLSGQPSGNYLIRFGVNGKHIDKRIVISN